MTKCPKHPRYKGIRKPQVSCVNCHAVFRERRYLKIEMMFYIPTEGKNEIPIPIEQKSFDRLVRVVDDLSRVIQTGSGSSLEKRIVNVTWPEDIK